jgi:hypothetical protein
MLLETFVGILMVLNTVIGFSNRLLAYAGYAPYVTISHENKSAGSIYRPDSWLRPKSSIKGARWTLTDKNIRNIRGKHNYYGTIQ